jgi:hypothetical protein
MQKITIKYGRIFRGKKEGFGKILEICIVLLV